MRILRLRDLIGRTGLSRTTIWRLERAGLFPQRFHLSKNSVGWDEDEIVRWLASRPRGLVTHTATRVSGPTRRSMQENFQ